MATGKRITVTDAATLLHQASASAGAEVQAFNSDADVIDLGGSGVTTGAGYEVAAAGSSDSHVKIHLRAGEALYGISPATLTSVVHVLVTGE